MPDTYNGLAAFGEDQGTLWFDPAAKPLPLPELQRTQRWWRRSLRRRLDKRPLIWFVDDEQANREWFVEYHRPHLAVLTFSHRRHVIAALQAGAPCDAVVTDLFFPARAPMSDVEANRLLRIYQKLSTSPVSALSGLWVTWKTDWSLDGFDIARDVAEYAARRKESIPVLLFSRKATLLLNAEDWLAEPSSAVENSHWMLEKLDPAESGERARRAASIQRDRIAAVLKYRIAATPLWKKFLGRLNIGYGPVYYSLK